MKQKIKQIALGVMLCSCTTFCAASVFATENEGKDKKEANAKTSDNNFNSNAATSTVLETTQPSTDYLWNTTQYSMPGTCSKTGFADAGPNKSPCIGDPVTLGGTTAKECAIGTNDCGPCQKTYSWAPATGLSCTNCCHPVATPNSTTNYTLTVSYTCGTQQCPPGSGNTYNCCLDPCDGIGRSCGGASDCAGTINPTDQVLVTVITTCRLENPDQIPEVGNMLTNVYPNPSPGIFTLEQSEVMSSMEIIVFNLEGKAVWASVDNAPKQTIDLTGMNKGIYFIQVKNQDTVTFYKKVVVE